jgi:hypothetical protein
MKELSSVHSFILDAIDFTHVYRIQADKLATAGDDHIVRTFDLSKDSETFESQVAQFKTPVHAVALNNTGTVCAAAGE